MRIDEKINKYLNEDERGDRAEAKKLIKIYIDKHGKNAKKVRQAILDNFVNSSYARASNQQVEIMWNEYKRVFPS